MKRKIYTILGVCFIILLALYLCYYTNHKHHNIDDHETIRKEQERISPSEDGVEYIIPNEPAQNLPIDDSKEWNYIPLN